MGSAGCIKVSQKRDTKMGKASMSVKYFCRGRKLAEAVKDLAQQLGPLPKITEWWHPGSSPTKPAKQMPQQSQRAFTPVITLCWALVVDSTPPRENMGHSWHIALKARSSDTMKNSLPAISTVVCRGTRSCPKQEPSSIRADCSKVPNARFFQRGGY